MTVQSDFSLGLNITPVPGYLLGLGACLVALGLLKGCVDSRRVGLWIMFCSGLLAWMTWIQDTAWWHWLSPARIQAYMAFGRSDLLDGQLLYAFLITTAAAAGAIALPQNAVRLHGWFTSVSFGIGLVAAMACLSAAARFL